MGRKRLDVTGKRFGRLIALYIVGKSNNGTAIWLCQCDCGNKKEVLINNLKNNSTNSCGCFKKETLKERNKKYNNYNLDGVFGIGYTTKNEEFYFDLEDYDSIKIYCWSFDGKGYLRTGKNNKSIYMSKLILGYPDNIIIDHINGITYDNRKNNLRPCTMMNNSWNIKENRKNNTTGKTGVFLDKRDGRYYAKITCNHIVYNLGCSRTLEDVIKFRTDGEEKYFGDFRRNK